MVIGPAHAVDCRGALHDLRNQAATALPQACIRLGPVVLGMDEGEVFAALGKADDADETSPVRVFVYPRDLADMLARHPQPQADVAHSELIVVFRDHKVVSLSASSDARVPLPFGMGDLRLNQPMKAITDAIGMPLRWNTTHDEAFADPLPLSFDVDDVSGEVYGIHLAIDAAALGLGTTTRFHLHKDGTSGRVTGFDVTVN